MNKLNVLYYIICILLSLFLLIEINLLNNVEDLRERKIVYISTTGCFCLFYIVVFFINMFGNNTNRLSLFLSFLWILFLVILFYNSIINNVL